MGNQQNTTILKMATVFERDRDRALERVFWRSAPTCNGLLPAGSVWMATTPPTVKIVHKNEGDEQREDKIPLPGDDQYGHHQEDDKIEPENEPCSILHRIVS